MTGLSITLDGDYAWTDVAGQIDQYDRTRLARLTTLKGGMQSGKRSVSLLIPTVNGRWLFWETSAELFMNAARSVHIRNQMDPPAGLTLEEIQEQDAAMRETALAVAAAMDEYGGAFVKSLAECIRTADMENLAKLRISFPEYWHKYEGVAARKKPAE